MTLLIHEVRDDLPEGFMGLLADSLQDGHQFLQKLETKWISGTNRFAKPGERLLAALEGDHLVGIGGINIDPYLNDSTKGRIRHLYVHSAFRRKGIAAALLKNLEKSAVHHFKTLTLRTGNPQADLFYQTEGFCAVQDNTFVTHQKVLG